MIPAPLKILLLIVGMVFDVIAFSSRYYSYLVMPILKQRKRNIVLNLESMYRFSESGDSIIVKKGDDYLATVYVRIPIYVSATEMTADQKLDFGKQIGKLSAINKMPVRYSSQLYVMDKDDYIKEVRDAISSAENEVLALQEKSATPLEIERAKGKAEMWRNMLDNTSKESSLELINFAAVTATGPSEFEVVSMAQQKARDLISGISTTLGVIPSIATGEDIKRLIEPEYLIPFNTVSQQITEKIREEVV